MGTSALAPKSLVQKVFLHTSVVSMCYSSHKSLFPISKENNDTYILCFIKGLVGNLWYFKWSLYFIVVWRSP